MAHGVPQTTSPSAPLPGIMDGAASVKACRAVTWRSVGLGLSGSFLISLITPYNDLVLVNSPVTGNYLPVGALVLVLLVVLAINLPLRRWAPSRALTGGELAVALAMVLAACAVPASGLMKYLPATLVGIRQQAGISIEHEKLLTALDLPDWLFPTLKNRSFGGTADPVIANYLNKTPRDEAGLLAGIRAVPWAAWTTPALAWGILFACVYGAVLSMTAIVRRQWVENERLPFPLATVWTSLIEPPRDGRVLNRVLGSRAFCITALAVFALHAWNGLGVYFPRHVPPIPLRFDLSALLSEPPFVYAGSGFKGSTVYLSVVGITYFVQSKVAFSLWFFFVLRQVMAMVAGGYGAELRGLSDQVLGSLLAMGAMALWVGRRHYAMVLRAMFVRLGADEPGDPYMSYRAAGWCCAACCAGMVAWLVAAGATVAGAVVLVGLLMLTFLVMARVIAETGLIYATIGVWFVRPWVELASVSTIMHTTQRTFFLTNWINALTVPGLRETLSVYSTTAVRVADQTIAESVRGRRALIPLMGLALVVAYLTSGAASLYVEYNHATTADGTAATVNAGPIQGAGPLLSQASRYVPPFNRVPELSNAAVHMGVGAVVTGLLAFLGLRFDWWPLHPVGYLLWQSLPVHLTWFSLFVGWAAKVLLVRFGGSSLYRAAMPVFLGLIVGEAAAAAAWMIVGIAISSAGYIGYSIRLLPG